MELRICACKDEILRQEMTLRGLGSCGVCRKATLWGCAEMELRDEADSPSFTSTRLCVRQEVTPRGTWGNERRCKEPVITCLPA